MCLAHVASADDSDADLSHISLCFEIQFATGCKISILGIGVSQAAFWEPEAIRRICRCLREVTALMADGTVRLTVAQAIVRYLANQFIEIDGEEMRLCGGGFGIFGHGNVPCLGEALYDHRAELPLYRGQNEQSMGFAAAGLCQVQWLAALHVLHGVRRAGHGQPADLGGAGARQPVADADAVRRHVPHPAARPGAAAAGAFRQSGLGLNDAFKAVSRYWDRITHPAQIIQSLPAAIATMLDPADCGPAFLGLPQDVQGWAYDYPVELSCEEGVPHPPPGARRR
jgi:3D-(3,5/4)-trihydroxycyclohexane-1,2-dione acylhydrolase (decyclizing)